MPKGPSPLLGYNTNARHRGKVYHIQTEDSGINRPFINTHLFADGGRIIASERTNYEEYLHQSNYTEIVKKLMQEQHKAMFIALRDGDFDEALGLQPNQQPTATASTPQHYQPRKDHTDLNALERAAAARLAESPHHASDRPGHYQLSNAPSDSVKPKPPKRMHTGQQAKHSLIPDMGELRPDTSSSIFGSDFLSEKSLDEVILSYLADEENQE